MTEGLVVGAHKLDDILETSNSIELFDFVIDTLGESLNKELILKFHSILKNKTLDDKRGFAGCWKKIKNHIFGSKIEFIKPEEVENKMDQFLDKWGKSEKSIEDVISFHVEFELIHPHQDGNGRIGRFVMLKQCIENNAGLSLIHEQLSLEYNKAMEEAQIKKNYTILQEVFKDYDRLLKEKLSFLEESITYINENLGVENPLSCSNN